MRKYICTSLVFVVLLSTLSMFVGAIGDNSVVSDASELGIVEPKTLSTTSLEADFADNHVIVVLNNKASLKFKTYSTVDFAEVQCSAVRDLSIGKKKQMETKVRNFRKTESTMSVEERASAVKEICGYNQIICLELTNKGKENVLNAAKALQTRDDVMYAGPDYAMSHFAVAPNDTYVSQQWAISAIDLDDAWEITTGSPNVYVGILDSGIDAGHPDLQGRIASSLCANFNSPYIHTVPSDTTGHGTSVAGIIAASMNNNQGIAGSASGVKIVALRVTNSSGVCPLSYVLSAVDYAEELGLHIINCSFGINNIDNDSLSSMEAAIENYSGLVVCSAGNDDYDNDVIAVYPASLDCENIISVGASTQMGRVASFSNYGATSVDVFAPGDQIMSCFPTAKCESGSCTTELEIGNVHYSVGYHSCSGTSFAAPYVTAIAALMISKNSSLTPQQIKSIIISTCTDSNNFLNKCVSDGVVNAYRALMAA